MTSLPVAPLPVTGLSALTALAVERQKLTPSEEPHITKTAHFPKRKDSRTSPAPAALPPLPLFRIEQKDRSSIKISNGFGLPKATKATPAPTLLHRYSYAQKKVLQLPPTQNALLSPPPSRPKPPLPPNELMPADS